MSRFGVCFDLLRMNVFKDGLILSNHKNHGKRPNIPIDVIYMIVYKLKSSRDIAPLLILNKSWYIVAYAALWNTLSLSKSQNLLNLINVCKGVSFTLFKSENAKRSTIVMKLRKTENLDLSTCKWSSWLFCGGDPSVYIRNLLKFLPKIKQLVLPPTKILKPMYFLKDYGSKLHELDLTSSLGDRNRSFENILRNIVDFCPNLRILRLPCVCQDVGIIYSLSLNELGKLLNLEEISVNHVSEMIHSHSSPLRGLFRSITNLRKVELINLCCSEYIFLEIIIRWQNVVKSLIIHNHNLTDLELSISTSSLGYNDMILLCLARHTKNLKRFSFKNSSFSDDAVQVFLEECLYLEDLELEESIHLSSRIFKILSNFGKNLKSLNLSNSQNLELNQPILAMKSIKRLNLSGITVSVNLFASCPSLENLIL